jgi:predicted nucleic acid-binding protein
MIYYDTNLLVYFTLSTLDKEKNNNAKHLILESIKDKSFLISPLVLSEYSYTLTKLKIDNNIKLKNIEYFKDYTVTTIDKEIVYKAIKLSMKLNIEKDINDCIHIILAEKYSDKIRTYDKDFKHFLNKINIDIEILS